MKRILSSALLVVLLAVPGVTADWGNISGKIFLDEKDVPAPKLAFKKGGAKKDPNVCSKTDVYDQSLLVNKENKGIANAFVFLYKYKGDVHPDMVEPKVKRHYFDQEDCVYTPRALVVQAGKGVVVEVLNADNVAHNTATTSIKNDQYNLTIPSGARKGDGVDYGYEVTELMPFEVKCSFHSHMFAYWLVLDHPYAAATDEDGNFTIKNLPVGDHEFRIWHERAGWLERKYKVSVKKGDNKLEPVGFKLEAFEED